MRFDRFNRAFEITITPNLGQPPISLFEIQSDVEKYKNNQFTISHPVIQGTKIEDGLTVRFAVERGINVVNNKADITIINLNPFSRKYLYQDLGVPPYIDKNKKELSYRLINLHAGYLGSNRRRAIFDRIFLGNIMEGSSYGDETEMITRLHCQENGYFIKSKDGFVNKGLEKAGTKKDFLEICLEKLGYKLSDVIVSSSFKQELNDPISKETHIGGSVKLLRDKFGLDFYVDNGKAFLLKNDEAFNDLNVPLITSESGLRRGSPVVKETTLEVVMDFEPRFKLGHVVEINSSVSKQHNGQYKITEIKHNGVISPTENGDLTTTLGLFRGRGGIKSI